MWRGTNWEICRIGNYFHNSKTEHLTTGIGLTLVNMMPKQKLIFWASFHTFETMHAPCFGHRSNSQSRARADLIFVLIKQSINCKCSLVSCCLLRAYQLLQDQCWFDSSIPQLNPSYCSIIFSKINSSGFFLNYCMYNKAYESVSSMQKYFLKKDM